MKITVQTISHNNQRYETVGDWIMERDTLQIRVSKLDNWKMEALVAVHELVEALLCLHSGVRSEAVDKFDMDFEKTRAFSHGAEPGDQPDAPYRDQHCFATAVERMLCAAMGMSWAEYETELDKLCKD